MTDDRRTRPQGGIGTGLMLILAAAAGLSAANLYYAQPLLNTIAETFHVGTATAGLIVTLSQIGYAIGLALVVPAGDIVQRRSLSCVLLVGTAGALTFSAVAPGIGMLIGLAGLVGLGSVAAQVLVPLAASLADDRNRGHVVGTVMTGLLLGILLARTISGFVAGALGWRAIYWLAAIIALLLALLLFRVLPAESERVAVRYPALLRSMGTLLRREPLLRQRMLYGTLSFAAFSVLWTTVAFMLAAPPYSYGDAVIGLFGLVGAAGALSANVAGRFVDRGFGNLTTTVFATGIALSFGLIYLGHQSLVALILGILVLDIGVSGLQVTNQSLIYRLDAAARSRITAVYMTAYFVGGSLGSAVASVLYEPAGWVGISILGAVLGFTILSIHLLVYVRSRQESSVRSVAQG